MGTGAPGKTYDRAAMAVLAVAACAIAFTFRDYGISWDEPVQNEYGKLSLRYYLTLGRDQSSFSYINLFWYGALFDTLAAAANTVSPFAEYDTRHGLNALVGLLGLAATWRLGRVLGGPRVGFVATLLLALAPVWYGNSFINPKDIPFATAMTWSAVFLARLARALPAWRWGDFAGLGIAAGAAMGTRVGGLIALVYLGATLAMYGAMALLDRATIGAVARALSRLIAPTMLACALALATMYASWPWAQHGPIARPLEAFENFSRFPITLEFPYFGHIIVSTAVPWYYEPGIMAVTLPELTVAGFVVACVLALAHLFRDAPWTSRLPLAVLALLIVFPPAYVAVERAVLFDGMRHLIFVLPPLTVAAALAIDRIWRRGRVAGATVAVLLVLTTGQQLGLLIHSHPYQYLVFNTLVGGVSGANGKFELDYWGVAFREAVANMAARAPTPPADRPWRVMVCGPETSAELFFPPGFELIERQRVVEADFIITNTRFQCPRGVYQTSAPALHVVQRFHTPLAYVQDMRAHRALTYSPYPATP